MRYRWPDWPTISALADATFALPYHRVYPGDIVLLWRRNPSVIGNVAEEDVDKPKTEIRAAPKHGLQERSFRK
jgi:hypothetical protein